MKATVFGLDVRANQVLPFLETAVAKPTGRSLDVSLLEDSVDELDWPRGARLIVDQRDPDSAASFQIEASPERGYRIWGSEYGTNILSGDGRWLRGAPGSGGLQGWQRMLVAQVLPFAAVLQGLEVLHASAVVIDQMAVAITGPSGSGKTSLALALCRRGADFLADDVLALERVGEDLIGHSGAPVAGVDHAEADRLREVGAGEYEELAVNPRERLARMAVCAEPTPLRALFLIDRRPEGPSQPRFEQVADTRMLLAATFNLVLLAPERLERLLDACALIARKPPERVVVGPAVDASELAAAVEARIGASR